MIRDIIIDAITFTALCVTAYGGTIIAWGVMG